MKHKYDINDNTMVAQNAGGRSPGIPEDDLPRPCASAGKSQPAEPFAHSQN